MSTFPFLSRSVTALAAVGTALVLWPGAAVAQTKTWLVNGNRTWSVGTNWLGGTLTNGNVLQFTNNSSGVMNNRTLTNDIVGFTAGTGSGTAINVAGVTNMTFTGNTLGLNGTLAFGGALGTNANNIRWNIGMRLWTNAGIAASGSASAITVGGGIDLNTNNLRLSGAGGATISGVITGTGTVNKVEGGTWTLTGNNAWTGTLTVATGTVNIGVNNLNAGTLGVGGVALSNNTQIVFNRLGRYAVSNAISGPGSVVVNANGPAAGSIFEFEGVMTGVTNFRSTSGLAVLASTNVLPTYATANRVTANGTGALAVRMGGSATDWTLGDFETLRSNAVKTSNAGIGIEWTNTSTALNYAGYTNGEAYGFVKAGAGALNLTASNNFTGTLFHYGGTLNAGGNLPTNINLTLGGGNGGVLDLGGMTASVKGFLNQSDGVFRFTNGSLLLTQDANIQFGRTNGTIDLSGLNSVVFNAPTRAFSVQSGLGGGNTSSLYLAAMPGGSNYVRALEVIVGASAGSDVANTMGVMRLGQSNVFHAANVIIGGYRSGGTMNFNESVTNGSLVIRGTDGVSAANLLRIGEKSDGSGNARPGLLNLSNGVADIRVTNLIIATTVQGQPITGTMIFNGNLEATNIVIAQKTGSQGNGNPTGTLTQLGGSTRTETLELGSLQFTGTGTPVINATFNLDSGSLRAGTIYATGTNAFSTSSTRTINFNSGTLGTLGAGRDLLIYGSNGAGGAITVNLNTGSNHSFHAHSGSSVIFSNHVILAGSGSLAKDGEGTLLLMATNVNTFSGPILINEGTLQVGAGGTSGNLGAGAVTNNGALVLNRSDGITFANAISGTGSVTKLGGNVTLTSAASDFTGRIFVQTNVLQYDTLAALGTGTNTLSLGVNASLRPNASGSVDRQIEVDGKDAQINTLGSRTATFTGGFVEGYVPGGTDAFKFESVGTTIVSGLALNLPNLQVNKGQGGTLEFNVAGNQYKLLWLYAGTVQTGVDDALDADALVDVRNSPTAFNVLDLNGYSQTVGGLINGTVGSNQVTSATLARLTLNNSGTNAFAGSIAGSIILAKTNLGTQILSGSNTYAGPTLILEGELQIGNGGLTGSLGGGAVTNDATLIFNRSNTLQVDNLISGSGDVYQSGSGTTIFTADNTYSGDTIITNGTLQIGNGGTTGAFGTGTLYNDATLAFNRSDDVTFTNAMVGDGAVLQMGPGMVTLAANYGYGATIIESGRTLRVGNGGTIGSLGNGRVTNNGVLQFNRSDALTIGNQISGAGVVHQIGTGTTTLTNNNTYTGDTIISNGTLLVENVASLTDSATGSGTVRVLTNGTLGGSGSIGGAVIVDGRVTPGSSPGILQVNSNLTFNTTSELVIEINGTIVGTQYDQILMGNAGILTLNGGPTLTLNDTVSLSGAYVLEIIKGFGSVSGTFAGLIDGATINTAFNQFIINYGTLAGYSSSVTLTPVPEPGSAAALAGALGLLLRRRRRRS